jgi:hypothetical protein
MKHAHRNGNGYRVVAQWKEHLSSYRELSELRFSTPKENRRALELLDSNALRDMPYGLTGRGIIVPAEGVPYFKSAGRFAEKKLDLR